MPHQERSPGVDVRKQAGHYEILGETIAKIEFFEKGWNPYSRFLDVDKIDLILRRKISGRPVYREVQVKYGKLFEDLAGPWERQLFDCTSWRFFKEDEFRDDLNRKDFFIAYVLARDIGYRDDIFIFPVSKFAEIVRCGIPAKGQRKVCISRQHGESERWFLRRAARFGTITDETCLDVSQYRRNFSALEGTG